MAAVVVASVALAYLLPLLLSRYFPGLDLPWHAATAEVLHRHDAAEVNRDFLGYVVVDRQITTYLTMYVAVDLLGFVTGDIALAMQVLIALYVLAFVWSVRRLVRSFGGDGVVAVLAAPAAYSVTMEYGFLAYALCYPLTFWLWALLRELFSDPSTTTFGPGQRRAMTWRLAVIGILGALISLSHPFAAAVAIAGGVLVIACHAERGEIGRAAAAFLLLVAGALPMLLALASMGGGESTSHWQTLNEQSLLDKIRTQQFVSPAESLATAPVRLFGFITAGWCFILAGAGLVAAVVARHFGGLPDREPGLRGRAAAWLLVAMVAIYLVTPYTFEWPHRWYGAQPRLLPIVWVLGLLLLRAQHSERRPVAALLAPVAVAAMALALLLFTTFLPFAREASDFREVVGHAAPRARTLGLIEQPRTVDRTPASPFRHFAAYVFVERGGLSSGLPMVRPSGGNAGFLSPVRPAGDAPPLPRSVHPGFPRSFDFAVYGQGWDQFLIRDADPAQPFDYFRQHADRVRLVARSGRWRLYAVKR